MSFSANFKTQMSPITSSMVVVSVFGSVSLRQDLGTQSVTGLETVWTLFALLLQSVEQAVWVGVCDGRLDVGG